MDAPFTLSGPATVPIPIDWEAVESWLGLRLPTDYKALATDYGPLLIGEYLWLHTPCAKPGRFDYGDWLKDTHRLCRASSKEVPPHTAPPFHPKRGGLLAWGKTRSSSYMLWDTAASANPDQWPVVVMDRGAVNNRLNPWHNYEMPVTELIAAVVSTGVPLPGNEQLGPLPPTAERTAFLVDAGPWTPPPPTARRAAVSKKTRLAALKEGSGLAALRLLAPPPAKPYLGDGSWERLFEELGTRLPTDYIELMDTYGAGCWSEWLNFVTPLRTNGRGFAYHANEVLDGYRNLRAQHPEFQPLAVWPEPGGFLPFANSVEGDVLGWLTQGSPDEWPLIVYPRHAAQGPPLQGTVVDTLLDWLRGRLVTAGFPSRDDMDDPSESIGFQPWNDESCW
jgi:hypothetical protein